MARMLALLVTCLLGAGASALAHHSYGATYDVSKEIKLEGRLVQFTMRNPHSFVTLVVPDGNGGTKRWSVEWAAPTQLGNQGVKQESLRVGDEIVIVGRPSRVPGELRALMVSLRRPSDGFTWGTRPGEVVD